MDQLLTIFSKIDLHDAYSLLRIQEGDENLNAFRAKSGRYEYLVMPFGCTNAPASFQNLVNDIFADFSDIFVVAYLDDVMIFSSTKEEHFKHVAAVLQRLKENIWQDKYYEQLLKKLARGESVKDYSIEPQAKLLLFKDRVAIPSNQEPQLNILQKSNDPLLAGHPGQEKTPKLIKRDFYWAGMNQTIKEYVSSFHPVFHVSLLEPLKKSAIPRFHQSPPPPVLVEEKEEWEVAQVLDSKLKRGKSWYLVEWKGFSEDPERTTWEPASNLTKSPDLVNNFHTLYHNIPGPNTSRV
ncbi:hypothetical protein O181_008009 [Austropuccinia psidii MF-1]|uniref:Chromo domain-containing protein n=1 Tax=Austropuccinia psidii MF-1 TaxID=1389203 RepID=A0A9Q3GIG1_9BASI|nr:hypothetical protein [Austropuccinia psidii MF-1]